MTDEPERPGLNMNAALLVEGALAAIAVVLGAVIGFSPLSTLGGGPGWWAALIGTLAAAPLVGLLLLIEKVELGPLTRLSRYVEQNITPLFRGASVLELAALSLAAGVGEELLFRGLLQAAPTHWLGPRWGLAVGLTVGSLTFGVAHFITPTYMVLAMVMGVYFGLLFWWCGDLLAPIAAHAVYDFAALMYMVKIKRAAD